MTGLLSLIASFGEMLAKKQRLSSRLPCCLIDAQDICNMGDYGIGIGGTQDQIADLLVWADEFLAPVQGFTAGKKQSLLRMLS